MLNQIYSLARPVEESERKLTKYHFIGYAYNKNIKIFDIENLHQLLIPNKTIPNNFIEFILDEKSVILIPNIINNMVVEIICRSISKKRFINISDGMPSVFYNIGGLSKNRHYTDKIIICEGIADCEYIKKHIYTDVIACLTDNISGFKLEILKTLTNHVVLSFDNDKAGQEAVISETKKLKRNGFFVETMTPPDGFKDFGDLIQFDIR